MFRVSGKEKHAVNPGMKSSNVGLYIPRSARSSEVSKARIAQNYCRDRILQ